MTASTPSPTSTGTCVKGPCSAAISAAIVMVTPPSYGRARPPRNARQGELARPRRVDSRPPRGGFRTAMAELPWRHVIADCGVSAAHGPAPADSRRCRGRRGRLFRLARPRGARRPRRPRHREFRYGCSGRGTSHARDASHGAAGRLAALAAGRVRADRGGERAARAVRYRDLAAARVGRGALPAHCQPQRGGAVDGAHRLRRGRAVHRLPRRDRRPGRVRQYPPVARRARLGRRLVRRRADQATARAAHGAGTARRPRRA